MKPRITLITLGVYDLKKSVEFYTKLGFKTDGIVGEEFEYGAVAFFDLQNGLKMALWPYKSIEHDTGLVGTGHNPVEMTLAYNVNSSQEVDDAFQQAMKAGAKEVKAPNETFWGGYTAYIQDLDGHVWEIAWNPDIQVADKL